MGRTAIAGTVLAARRVRQCGERARWCRQAPGNRGRRRTFAPRARGPS